MPKKANVNNSGVIPALCINSCNKFFDRPPPYDENAVRNGAYLIPSAEMELMLKEMAHTDKANASAGPPLLEAWAKLLTDAQDVIANTNQMSHRGDSV